MITTMVWRDGLCPESKAKATSSAIAYSNAVLIAISAARRNRKAILTDSPEGAALAIARIFRSPQRRLIMVSRWPTTRPPSAVAIARYSQSWVPSGLATPSAASTRQGMSPAYLIWRLISSRSCRLRSVIPIGAEAAEAGPLGAITTTVAPLFSACSTSGFSESANAFAAGAAGSAADPAGPAAGAHRRR